MKDSEYIKKIKAHHPVSKGLSQGQRKQISKNAMAKKMKFSPETEAAYKKLMADPNRGFKNAPTKENLEKAVGEINHSIAKRITSKY